MTGAGRSDRLRSGRMAAALVVRRGSGLLARAATACGRHAGAPLPAARRWVGESSGLGAVVDRSTVLRNLDTMGHQRTKDDMVIDSYASWGVTVNGVAIEGPVLMLPHATFLFSPPRLSAVTPTSLALLQLLEERLTILVVGTGRTSQRVPRGVRDWADERGIAIEALPTRDACATFNFLASEGRPVAAVLFPLDEAARRNRGEEELLAAEVDAVLS